MLTNLGNIKFKNVEIEFIKNLLLNKNLKKQLWN
jgi:hypothetical protein